MSIDILGFGRLTSGVVGELLRPIGICSEKVPPAQCPFVSKDEVRDDGDRRVWKNWLTRRIVRRL